MKTKVLKSGGAKNVRSSVLTHLSFLMVATLFLFLVSIPANAESKNEGAEATGFAPGVMMVKFNQGVKVEMEKGQGYVATGISSIDALNKKYGVKEFVKIFSPEPKSEKGMTAYRELGLDRVYRFETSPKADVQAMVAEFKADPSVEYAEPDYVGHAHFIPNDPNFVSRQWGLYNTGLNPPEHPGTVDADVDATEAWVWWAPEHVIILAILDTGVDYDHPDFWRTYPSDGVILRRVAECSGMAGIDDDGNGYVDDCWGFDFVNGTYSGGVWWNDADGPMDDNGHGTVNAGIAGALTNNSLGVASLLGGPFNPHRIMPVKVLNSSGSGQYSWWEAGLYYAANNNASVINMSMGGTSFSSTLQSAVNYAWSQGCVVVASMGNCNSSTPQYPAAFTNTIAVGATDTDDSRCVPPDWDFMGYDAICGSVHGSNYGSHIDVVAPGNWIYSTDWNNHYDYWAGTSMAAPLVSGLAAMIMCQTWPEPSPDSVRQIIQSTADDRVGLPGEDTPGWDQYYGWGRINAKRALGVPTPIYSEDFNDCDITDWTVYTSSGTFATTNSQWVSPPCGLYMSSVASGYAYGRTPNIDIDTTEDFTITTYFRVPDANNHWFWVLSNRWVELVIDYGTDLCAYQGSQGPTLLIAALNTNQWYHIKTVVHPATSNYDIYLNCFYITTAKFPDTYLRYLRLGEFENGGANVGQGYWDDISVFGKKSFLCGDVNRDGVVSSADVVYLINYLFIGGPAPQPLEAGDVNLDGGVSVADVVYLINYLFIGGPAPCAGKCSSPGSSPEKLNENLGKAKIGLSVPTLPEGSPTLDPQDLKRLEREHEIVVWGEFDQDVAGVQLEIGYDPQKVTLLEPKLTSRTQDLSIFFSGKEGLKKIGIVDLTGKNPIPAGEGALVTLSAGSIGKAKGKDLASIQIKKAILVNREAEPLEVELSPNMEVKTENAAIELPDHFSLSQNHPNPFNPETDIEYALPKDTDVKLTIYNMLGQKIKVLVDERQTAGYKNLHWDGRDQKGEKVASGIYFYRLETNEFSEVKKMLVVK